MLVRQTVGRTKQANEKGRIAPPGRLARIASSPLAIPIVIWLLLLAADFAYRRRNTTVRPAPVVRYGVDPAELRAALSSPDFVGRDAVGVRVDPRGADPRGKAAAERIYSNAGRGVPGGADGE